MPDAIQYTVVLQDPNAHLFRVTCLIKEPCGEGQLFTLPAWIPGSYMIRDFARNIVAINASDKSGSLDVTRYDKNSWLIQSVEGELEVVYEVYAWDLSVRSAYFDQFRAYFNGTSLFLLPIGKESSPCLVDITSSNHAKDNKWSVATGLACVDVDQWGFGRYKAENYDALIDCPVEISSLYSGEFIAHDTPHKMVFSGHGGFDIERVCKDVQSICDYQLGFFGEPLPIKDYLFMTMVVGNGYGGLEHRNSTSLMCSRKDLPVVGDSTQTDDYRTFLALCSHEYFHTWNIKRIKPKQFLPYDLSKEVHTSLLWVFEGFTSYYDELILLRSGVIDEASYLELLGQTITRVLRGSGRGKQSLAESSFDAWTKFYKQDENAPNAIVSYYTKGAMVALSLDLTIRHKTRSERSLDDVMRLMWKEYGAKGKGVEENEMPAIIQRAVGVDLANEIDRWTTGVEELPLDELLADFGINMALRATQSQSDKGGKACEDVKLPVVLGVRHKVLSNGVELTHVLDGGAAQQAGLAAGDQIIAIDGIRLEGNQFEAVINQSAEEKARSLHAFRRDQLLEFTVFPQLAPLDTCVLTMQEQVTASTEAMRRDWLFGSK